MPALELSDLRAKNFDLNLTSFELQELEKPLAGDEKQGLTDVDSILEEQKEIVPQLGDMWLLGEHRLLCGG